MIIIILLGVIVWFVLPLFLIGKVKKKSDKKAFAMLCKVIGLFLIAWGMYQFIF